MGSILLLSRDQEISLARRMERGEKAILKALVKTPFTLDEIVALEALLKQTPEAFVKYFNMAEDASLGREPRGPESARSSRGSTSSAASAAAS